jgi:hypothetical protein
VTAGRPRRVQGGVGAPGRTRPDTAAPRETAGDGADMQWGRDPGSHDQGRLALIASVSATVAYGLTRVYSSLADLPEGAASIPAWGIFFGCYFGAAWLLTQWTGGAR